MTARKKYSKEFKLDAIALVVEQQYNKTEAARNLGLSPQILGRWLKEAEDDDGHAFRGNGVLTPEQAEIRNLKGQGSVSKWSVRYQKKRLSVCYESCIIDEGRSFGTAL